MCLFCRRYQPSQWLWDFGEGNTSTQQNPVHTYSTAGSYTVCLIAISCAGQDTICQTLNIEAPDAAFTFEAINPNEYSFSDQSTNAPTAWLWDFGDGTTSTEQHPIHTFTSIDTFEVCLIVSNIHFGCDYQWSGTGSLFRCFGCLVY